MIRYAAQRGLTLAELLITVAVLSILAAVALPTLSYDESRRLAVAAERTVQALRYARSEAMRSGQPVLVDAETSAGRLLLLRRDCTTTGPVSPVDDPLTKRAYAADIGDGAHTSGVGLTARIMVGANAYAGLVFDASGAAVRACSVAAQIDRGAPASGSSIDLAYAGRSRSITIDPPTGRIGGLDP